MAGNTQDEIAQKLGVSRQSVQRMVSLVGNILLGGSASAYDVVVRMVDRVNARHFPMTDPVLSRSAEDKEILQKQEHVSNILELASQADVTFVGIGDVVRHSLLYVDGFITFHELNALEEAGVAGEIISWVYNADGKLVDGVINDRVTSVPIIADSEKPVFGVAVGDSKVSAIIGALRGKLINSFITNERTAELVLSQS